VNVVVFLGPSLPLDEARAICPTATIRPPAAQSDIVTAVEAHGAEAIGLIDGTFRQSLSVWHSEICYALSRGVEVYGASSMGALRAAETARFGMVGVGRVHQWYADGTITADDEVALAHGGAESGYQQLSEPLVNIRASLAQAMTGSLLDQAAHDLVVEVARSIYYPERSVPTILAGCRERGMDDATVARVADALTTGYVDVKRLDARELLMRLHERESAPARPAAPTFEFAGPYVFQTLYNHDRRIDREGIEAPLQLVAEHVAIHCPEFAEIRDVALNEALVGFLGLLLEVEVTDEECAEASAELRDRLGVASDGELAAWLRANDLNREELAGLVRRTAVCRRLQRWLLANRGLDRGTRYFLDELRRRGTYPAWAARAVEETSCATAFEATGDYDYLRQVDVNQLAAEHAAATGVRFGADLGAWAEIAGFEDLQGLKEALDRSAIFRDVQRRIRWVLDAEHPWLAPDTPPPCSPGEQAGSGESSGGLRPGGGRWPSG